MEKIAWLILDLVTFVSAIVAQWRPTALRVGRLALGVFYIVAGAVVHAIYLATGASYATFADAAHVTFVRTAWHATVAPHGSTAQRTPDRTPPFASVAPGHGSPWNSSSRTVVSAAIRCRSFALI